MEKQTIIPELIDTYGYKEPTDQQVAYCHGFIQRNYFNREDMIRDAFRLGAESDILKSIFSVKEIIRVIKNYEHNKGVPKYEALPEAMPTPHELDLIETAFKKTLVKELDRFCQKGYYCLTPAYCYHYLEDKGLIEKNLHQSEEIKALAKEATKGQIYADKGLHVGKDIISQWEQGMAKDERAIFKTRCQSIAFDRFFIHCRDNKLNLKEMLNI